MSQQNIKKSQSYPVLYKGWQANLELKKNGDQIIVQKIYGINRGWRKENACDLLKAIHVYYDWIKDNGVLLAPLLNEDISCRKDGWIITIQQPYLGFDCEVILQKFGKHYQIEDAITLFNQLLKTTLKLAYNPTPPFFRCEIKPRDFCLGSRGIPILVDTFPPVIARRKNKVICANRRLIRSCIIEREFEEVLDVTGSPLGIIRNLCEHVMAIIPKMSDILIRKVVKEISCQDNQLGQLIKERLITIDTAKKVQILKSRIEKRGV